MKLLTAKQRDTIESMYLSVFGDELSFLAWLRDVHEYFSIADLDTKTASRVIDDLKGMKKPKREVRPKESRDNTQASEFWLPVIKIVAKIYLKGVQDGQNGKRVYTVDEAIEEIKDELR
jgi:hypothetical protein